MSARFLKGEYLLLLEDLKAEKFGRLDFLHHLLSGFKSLFSQEANDGILAVRQALGGAGYTAWSGLPAQFDHASPAVTFEGDNTVMAIQSTNYLKRLIKQLGKGEKVENPVLSYLNEMDELV